MAHYLIQLSEAAFADIPNKAVPRTVRLKDPAFEGPKAAEWILSGYCEKLLSRNEGLQDLLGRFAGNLDDPACRTCLTQGQRILYTLGALDGQVKNGGLAQFFWNCPDLVLEVPEALASLGETELADAYEKALTSLIRNKEEWVALRKQAGKDPGTFWEPFAQSYALLDLTWFDTAFFETYGPALVARLVEYVKSHKGEFIES